MPTISRTVRVPALLATLALAASGCSRIPECVALCEMYADSCDTEIADNGMSWQDHTGQPDRDSYVASCVDYYESALDVAGAVPGYASTLNAACEASQSYAACTSAY